MAWGFSWDGGKMPMNIKSAVQLKQEAAEIIAMGGGVQFYFQQNRDLSIKPWIGEMLADIGTFCRERQAYVHKAVPVPQIALLYPTESFLKSWAVPYSGSTTSLQGALYALLDGQQAVEVRAEHNLTGQLKNYPLIIVPECNYLDSGFADELKKYVFNGGKLLVIGPDAAMIFSEQLRLVNPSKTLAKEAFIEAKGRLGAIRSEILTSESVENKNVFSVFFSGSDFNQKGNFPSATVSAYGKGKIGAIFFNAGSCYEEYKSFVLRDYVNGLVDELFSDRVIKLSGSQLAHIAVNTINGRMYVNIINASGDHAGRNTIGYDQLSPLPQLGLSVKYPLKPSGVVLQPGGVKLKYEYNSGIIKTVVPPVVIHSIIEIY
jgi:hypothetical protein